MARKPKHDDLAQALSRLAQLERPRAMTTAPKTSARPRMMTTAQRVAFADDIRSRSRTTSQDSTELIRRDRDER